MKNKTRDYQSLCGTVRFELSFSETLSEKPIYRHQLSGWVEGFGPRMMDHVHADHDVLGSGPYSCQYWLKDILPQVILDEIQFDSESSEFYCYSSDRDHLEIILGVLTGVIDRLDSCFEEYATQRLTVFNDDIRIVRDDINGHPTRCICSKCQPVDLPEPRPVPHSAKVERNVLPSKVERVDEFNRSIDRSIDSLMEGIPNYR